MSRWLLDWCGREFLLGRWFTIDACMLDLEAEPFFESEVLCSEP